VRRKAEARDYREAAEKFRAALRLIGFPEEIPDCMPGEPHRGSCDLPVEMHMVGYMVMMSAAVDHWIGHFDDPGMKETIDSIHELTTTRLQLDCPFER
jgi:hypothetical protein